MNNGVALNNNKGAINCRRMRRNAIKSAEQSGGQDIVQRFAERDGTLRTADFSPILKVVKWPEQCSGGKICVRSKKILNTPAKDIL